MPDVNLYDVEASADQDDPDGYHASYVRVGPLIGATALGATVYDLPPGQSVCPYHYEHPTEEWLFVLAGRPSLRHPEGEDELDPGDVVCFLEGPEGAHKVTNRTEEPVRIAILSTKPSVDVVFYPDSDKIAVSPPGKIFRAGDAVDYWTGEV